MKIRSKHPVVLVAAALIALPGAANADWIVRLGGAWVEPGEDSLQVPAGFPAAGATGGDFQLRYDGPVVAGDVTWLFTKHLGVEFWANAPFNSKMTFDTPTGSSAVGEVDFSSPMVNLQWHFLPDNLVRPYVGAGVAYTMIDEVTPSSMKLDDAPGWTAGAGVDIGNQNGGLLLNLYAKYLDASPDAEASITGPGATVGTYRSSMDIDPWIFGVSLGYRFGHAAPVAAAVTAAAPVAVAAAAPAAEAPPPPPPPPPPLDTDGDKVIDSLDACPKTPRGEQVDAQGCSCVLTMRLQFAVDSADLSADDKIALNELVATLVRLDTITGEVSGHTDNSGKDSYNLQLSKRRAQSVVDYLVANGVKAGRFTAVGYGETQPVADNATPEGRAENRRVVLRRTNCTPIP